MTDYSYRNDPAVPPFPDDKPVFVFDGQCGFCSAWVQFALKRDRRRRYRFLAAQSEIGAALYRHYGLDERLHETSLFLENGRPYLRVNGIIRLLAGLGFPWTACHALGLIPRLWADALYDHIARNRYRIARTSPSCSLPNPADADRFMSPVARNNR
ncbi:thiol-disulfide oxidoreductase DCC family protein [Sinorhizobium alkalisoli]|uniref:Thiol-disulfide oxidoreductase n=1 Tax=Sinorhizobium alkalisoli TaxID=1752398 RepID=A0A1E3VHP9_9HYPH|nr:DCC1-like thiol-disulfide oxidoreductase family protein [Sinorhizobium alkalisoli]MCG5478649.1 DUF393 domain-containing protein [Sinorhizobium alkalisoli]ODR93119.1 thiol-disulfide oxidoreductase [Sinorhizobium alkalisoli]QFI70577.1 hypothetical protein EKH55_5703 [Sinorhizobium alkalisoli]